MSFTLSAFIAECFSRCISVHSRPYFAHVVRPKELMRRRDRQKATESARLDWCNPKNIYHRFDGRSRLATKHGDVFPAELCLLEVFFFLGNAELE